MAKKEKTTPVEETTVETVETTSVEEVKKEIEEHIKVIDAKKEYEEKLDEIFKNFNRDMLIKLCYRLVIAPPLDVFGAKALSRIGEIFNSKSHSDTLILWDKIKSLHEEQNKLGI
jgi:hypothetical protein